MAQLRFSKPAAFTTGIVGNVLESSVLPSDDACHLSGAGTFSWLIRFDILSGTLFTGGAKPTASPDGPFTFVSEMVSTGMGTLQVVPVNLPAPLSTTCKFDSAGGDLVLPIYLDSAGTQALYLPLRGMHIKGAMTPDHGCIGRYNAEALDPANACFPDNGTPAFQDGGQMDASIVLEDADKIPIPSLNQTLCVLLTGNPSQFGQMGPNGMTVCKRTNGKIVFPGDWCAATNQQASPTCADAVLASAGFAAQAVTIQ